MTHALQAGNIGQTRRMWYFYRAETFVYLAKLWGWRCEIPIKDVALLQRPLV